MSYQIQTVLFLSLHILIGCGSTKTAVLTDGETIVVTPDPANSLNNSRHSESISELRLELASLGEAYRYLNSEAGKKNYVDGLCSIEVIKEREVSIPPVDACKTEDEQIPIIRDNCEVERKCDLVSALVLREKLAPQWDFISALGCSYNDEEQTLLTQSGVSMSAAFCALGAGKAGNKYLKLFRLGRAAACGYSLQNIIKKSDRLASCMNFQVEHCTQSYERWNEAEEKDEENYRLREIILKNELSRCEEKTAVLNRLDIRSIEHLQEEIVSAESEIEHLSKK